MSIQYINWVIKAPSDRTPVQQLVLLVLADICNEEGRAWPSVATIARRSKLKHRTVQRALRALVDRGDLHVARRGGGRVTTMYLVTRAGPPVVVDIPGGVRVVPEGCGEVAAASALDHGSGDTVTPNPSVIPPVIQHRSAGVPAIGGKTDDELLCRFERFWSAYPKHVARKPALEAWNRLSPNEDEASRIVESVRRYAAAPEWADVRYVPNPATFLNDARWEDNPHVAVRRQAGTGVAPSYDETQRYLSVLRGGSDDGAR